jgi:hypothetical protein|tara:strand:+ start:3447 stop:3551 length:105 start_codon:yes stop_codon:yes gene_type:complete
MKTAKKTKSVKKETNLFFSKVMTGFKKIFGKDYK